MSAGLRLIVCWAVLTVCCSAQAEDLGQVGRSWPVAEHDMAESLMARLRAKERSGELAKLHEGMRERAKDFARVPRSLGLPRALRTRSFRFDPSITVPYDLRDSEGRVFQKAGTSVNPLDHMTLTKRIVFVDAADATQLDWLRKHLATPGAVKLVLTGGSPEALSKHLQRPAWFDQDGSLVKTFGIRAVPAVVTQDGRQLRVQEEQP
ncbi:MAG: type-F conjugative transfer system protein TraW [Panacagrimonas sp.]